MPAFRPLSVNNGRGEPVLAGAATMSGKKVPPDAINILMLEHQEAMGYFDWCLSATDNQEKAAAARKLCTALRAHMLVEEEIFYPAAKAVLTDDDIVEHAYEEHQEAKDLLDKIESETESNSVSDVLVQKLRTSIQHHVDEEEGALFPRLRRLELDFYELGKRMIVLKLDCLFDFKFGINDNQTREEDMVTISTDEAKKLFLTGVRNARATALNCKEMTERQVGALDDYPDVKSRMQWHLADKDAQVERLDDILDFLGEERSALKDAAMTVAGNVSSMMNAMADDEIIKNSFSAYALANFETAAYESLIELGEAAGHSPMVLKQLQKTLSEERAMAAWLADNVRGVTRKHLEMRSRTA